MKRINITIAIILIAIGIISFAYEGIDYTTKKKVVKIGDVEVTAKTKKNIPLPPIIGAIALIGGIAILIMEKK